MSAEKKPILQSNHSPFDSNEQFEQEVKEQLAKVNALIEMGETSKAVHIIEGINSQKNDTLYREVGRLTRGLHESIQTFCIDSELDNGSNQSSISDASDRIAYVIKLTEDATNKTLDRIEASMSSINEMESEASALSALIAANADNTFSDDVLQRLSRFLEQSTNTAQDTRSHLSNILCAQEYQDLSAQALEHASNIIGQVETDLVKLVTMASHVDQITGTEHNIEPPPVDPESGQGPRITEDSGGIANQDDVDDLLSSLGF